MKKLAALILLCGLFILPVGPAGFASEGPAHNFLPGATEVLPNVYDDEQGNAYIRTDWSGINVLDEAYWQVQEKCIGEIYSKKKAWQAKFPGKKLIAMSIVPRSYMKKAYDSTYVVPDGLLIHYEAAK
jgi:hypothetical protein